MKEIFPLPNNLTPSLEDYLKTILILSQEKKVARVKEISEKLGVKTASVVGALKSLERKGYIIHERYGYVELTSEGEKIAVKLYYRHQILKKFFKEILALDEEEAAKNACQIEHYLTEVAVERLLKFIEFIGECPAGHPQWLQKFFTFVETGKKPPECEKMEEDNGTV